MVLRLGEFSCKLDLDGSSRTVSAAEGVRLAQAWDVAFIETRYYFSLYNV